jgi:putative nucleotidyltransferase with HDIG domain
MERSMAKDQAALLVRSARVPEVATRAKVWLARHVVEGYVAVLAALAFTWLALASFPADIAAWMPSFLVLTCLSTVLEFIAIPLARGGVLSLATTTHVASLLILPPPLAALSICMAVAIEELVRRTPLVKLVFNTSSFVLTALIASHAAGLLGNIWVDALVEPRDHLAVFGTIAVAGGIYYVLNAIFLSTVLMLATGESFLRLLRVNTRDTGLSELGAGTMGGLLALIWVVEPFWTPLLALPTAVIGRSLRHIRQLQSETRSAVRSLAELVDHRDPSTFHHSERVANYASALAREMQLDDAVTELIEQAAAVHDLGKIGVPDRVLLKPGPLDEAEQAAMWRHAIIGATILADYQLFREGSLVVRHHHEAYDGSGYPDGLAGEGIPLGARVIAVADAFDAMTSDRPYRAALSIDEAVLRLRAGAGTQWDPLVVGTFLRLMLDGRLPGLDRARLAGIGETDLGAVAYESPDGLVATDPRIPREELRDFDHPPTGSRASSAASGLN